MIEEKIVIGKDTKYPLNGMITLPSETNELLPAVVLVQGSGPSNMDSAVGNNRPFKDIAEGLSKRGIAVLRYDKRTFTYGKQMKDMSSITVKEETIEDAIIASDFLRNDPRIDNNKIFIIGHSLGGMLAPRIDDEGGNFAGIVIMAGSPRKLEEIMIDQNNDVLNSLNKILQFIAKKQITKLTSKFDNIYKLTDEEAKETAILGKHIKAYYFKEMGENEPSKYLKNLNKPVFVIQGDKDFQVSIEKDFNVYKELLKDKENADFKIYEGLNHLFMPSVYGKILKANKEYKVAQNVDNQVIEDIASWIKTNC